MPAIPLSKLKLKLVLRSSSSELEDKFVRVLHAAADWRERDGREQEIDKSKPETGSGRAHSTLPALRLETWLDGSGWIVGRHGALSALPRLSCLQVVN